MGDSSTSLLSVVVPCYNESDGLLRFHARLHNVLKGLRMRYEIIYVNDGSVDNSIDIMQFLQSRDTGVGVIDLSRNFGKEAALTAGIDHARGDAVIVIDADLQDPPECIPDMLNAWHNSHDVVAMKRADRSCDGVCKRLSARLCYRLLAFLSPVPIPSDVGDFRLLSRRAVDALKLLPERNRYMKGLFAWIGFPTFELTYRRDSRFSGDTKWPPLKLLGLAADGITSFSIIPLRFASLAGCVVAVGALLFALYTLLKTLLFGEPVAGFPTLMIGIALLGGVQLIAIGILGEYVGRVVIESKQRPLYLVDSATLPAAKRLRSAAPVSREAAG
jgi:glycosyltransferase involved in cell wall biosynthesis